MRRPIVLLRRLTHRLKRRSRAFMVGVAVVIGLAGGLGSVGFREFFFALRRLFWNTDAYSLSWLEHLPWYWVVGVPEVMEAVAVKQSRIAPQIIATKALGAGICVASGGSVGHEGPIVQIGAAIGSVVEQLFRVTPRRARTLVGCGAAAGIAATSSARWGTPGPFRPFSLHPIRYSARRRMRSVAHRGTR